MNVIDYSMVIFVEGTFFKDIAASQKYLIDGMQELETVDIGK